MRLFMVRKPEEGPCASPVPRVSMMAMVVVSIGGRVRARGDMERHTVAGAVRTDGTLQEGELIDGSGCGQGG